MKIVIEIELGNEEMQTGFDAVHVLTGNCQLDHRSPLLQLSYIDNPRPGQTLHLRDVNGNTVGKVEVLP